MDARTSEFAVAEAKARFSELLARAEAGEEIVIKRYGHVIARLVPAHREVADDRRRRREAFVAWRDAEGPALGAGLTIREMIDEGRR